MPPTDRHEIWPTQDGIDRSQSFAIIASLGGRLRPHDQPISTETRWGLSGEVQPQLERATNEAIQDILGTETVPELRAVHYQVGPASEGLARYIITIWECRDDVTAALSILADSWAVTEIAIQVKQRLSSWIHSYRDPRLDVTVAFPPEVLKLFCVNHVRCNYHPRAQLSSEWQVLTQEFMGGYVSPAHPSANLEYVVLVKGRGRTYTYRITGTGEVLAHSVREGNRVTPLPIPNLFSGSQQTTITQAKAQQVEPHATD